MPKIFVIMGKSATGKDTIYKGIVDCQELNLKKVVSYTTRPIREGETNGNEYYFVDDKRLSELKNQKKIIEHRAYKTVLGIWDYFTVDDGQIDLCKSSYIMIGTLESFNNIKGYFGEEEVYPIYIEVEDGIRLTRSVDREKKEGKPKYAEVCRRYLADEEDFSEDNILRSGIKKRYNNLCLDSCLKHIIDDIKKICYND